MLAGGSRAGAAATTNSPDFKEVYDLLGAHLPGATAESLNQAAVTGLLSELNGKAMLVSDDLAAATSAVPVKVAVLDQSVAYLRVGQITENLAARINQAIQTLPATNKPTGTILDLRFAAGDAYATVKASVDQLAAPKTPLIILVNAATRGAAEVLAAELHDAGALIIGNPTAGLALTTQDFPLANGQRLRIATTPIKLHGTEMSQVQPDITVSVSLNDERAFMESPYGRADQTGGTASDDTNNFAQLLDHTSEAELVRQKRKDGDGDENPEPPVKTDLARPVLRDPVLARAVDLVEGLAMIRSNHP